MKTRKTKKTAGINHPNGLANFEEDFLLPPSTDNLDDIENEDNKYLFGGRFSKEARAERKEGRKSRRADRKLTKAAIKEFKKGEKNKRQDKLNDAGEDISMTRKEKRENRKIKRKTVRAFKKEERGERRASKRALLAKQKKDRKDAKWEKGRQKAEDSVTRDNKVKNNVSKLNEKVGDTTPPVKKNEEKTDVVVKTDDKKKGTNRGPVSFSRAFRQNRDAGKKEFTWKGKKYHTKTKEEMTKKTKKKPVAKKPPVKTKKKNSLVEQGKRQNINPYAGPKY